MSAAVRRGEFSASPAAGAGDPSGSMRSALSAYGQARQNRALVARAKASVAAGTVGNGWRTTDRFDP